MKTKRFTVEQIVAVLKQTKLGLCDRQTGMALPARCATRGHGGRRTGRLRDGAYSVPRSPAGADHSWGDVQNSSPLRLERLPGPSHPNALQPSAAAQPASEP